ACPATSTRNWSGIAFRTGLRRDDHHRRRLEGDALHVRALRALGAAPDRRARRRRGGPVFESRGVRAPSTPRDEPCEGEEIVSLSPYDDAISELVSRGFSRDVAE